MLGDGVGANTSKLTVEIQDLHGTLSWAPARGGKPSRLDRNSNCVLSDLYSLFAGGLNAPFDRVYEVSGDVVSDALSVRRLPCRYEAAGD